MLSRGRAGLEIDRAAENLVAQRVGHDLLLRRAQRLETCFDRRRTGAAPEDIGIGVLRDRTFGKTSDELQPRRGVVVEIRNRLATCGDARRGGINVSRDDGLLRGRQVLEQRLFVGPQERVDDRALVGREVGINSPRRRLESDHRINDRALRCRQVGIRRAGLRLARRTPARQIDEHREVGARRIDPGLARDRAVVDG